MQPIKQYLELNVKTAKLTVSGANLFYEISNLSLFLAE